MYEISRLINHIIGNDKSKEKRLLEKLGYKDDLYRGYSKLLGLMQNGVCDDEFKSRLPRALGIEAKFVETAFKKTDYKVKDQSSMMKKHSEDMYKKRFKPYIWIEHEYDKLLNNSNIDPERYEKLKILELPEDIDTKPWDEQIKLIRNAINLDQKMNKTRLFGNAINYIYFKSINESYLFDNYGGFIKTGYKIEQARYAVG